MAVDHEARRREIAALTIDLIAREGIDAATIRRIAAEAGASTTLITHYFADKEELLLSAFELLSAEGEKRFEAELIREPRDELTALLTMVPWCPANVRRWKAYLAYWDEAARNPYLAGLIARSTEHGLVSLKALLRQRGSRGEALESGAMLLNALVQGLALQMLVAPEPWPEDRVRQVLSEAVSMAATRARGGLSA